jgi:hypothetical protein
MNRDNPAKHLMIPLLAAIIIYVIAYGGIEHLRNRKGPWQVTFTRFSAGTAEAAASRQTGGPTLLINQPALRITNIQVVFTNELPFTNPPAHLSFAQPRPVPYDLPFGRCIFMDTTFLPGTLTLQMFGHELELLPRTLIIDHQEHAWRAGEQIRLGRIR